MRRIEVDGLWRAAFARDGCKPVTEKSGRIAKMPWSQGRRYRVMWVAGLLEIPICCTSYHCIMLVEADMLDQATLTFRSKCDNVFPHIGILKHLVVLQEPRQ